MFQATQLAFYENVMPFIYLVVLPLLVTTTGIHVVVSLLKNLSNSDVQPVYIVGRDE